MRSVQLLLSALLGFGISACTTQQVDPTADIPILSYQTDISPIISANCALTDCHGSDGREHPLLTYNDVISYCQVEPGKPHNSKLYDIIRRYSGEGAMPPKPNDPLTDQQIGAIYVWILQGATEN